MAVALGSIDAITVTKLLRQPVHADMPVISSSIVQVIKLDLDQDLALAGLGENQPDRGAMPADQGEIDPIGHGVGPQGQRASAADNQGAVAIGVLGAKSMQRCSLHWCHEIRSKCRKRMKSNPDADPAARTIRSLVPAFRETIATRRALPLYR